MTNGESVDFLRWALPRMNLRWQGFRTLHRQVRKRIVRRVHDLELADLGAYRAYLTQHPEEWSALRRLCRVTISRFYRDRNTFHLLETDVLPRLAELARQQDRPAGVAWCAGCAAGEEAYTLTLMWRLVLARTNVGFRVLATDIDPEELQRARKGLFPASALGELPAELRIAGFDEVDGGRFRVRDRFREGIEFRLSDLAEEVPEGPFDLVLCRNLAFTYFDRELQVKTAARLTSRMRPGGVLVVGKREAVPELGGLIPLYPNDGIYVWKPPDPLRCK